MSIFKRPLKVLLLSIVAAMMDVCVMHYFTINHVSASMSFAMIAILTVSYGKKAAFVSGAIIGIVMEILFSSVPILYLIMYPGIATLCAQFLGDMSERQREKRRTEDKKRQDDLPYYFRIPLCAATSTAIVSVINMIYSFLSGFGISQSHFLRAFTSVFYTTLLSLALMIPVRYFLGMYGTRRERKLKRGEMY